MSQYEVLKNCADFYSIEFNYHLFGKGLISIIIQFKYNGCVVDIHQ